MNAVNAVQLFVLVWTFSAVCQADKDISVSCDDATGSVGNKVMFNCSVSLLIDKCCIKSNTFIYNDSKFCRKVLPHDSCEHSKSFTCSYTPNKTMTEKFSFFVQASCGCKITEFTVVTGHNRLLKTYEPRKPSSSISNSSGS
ncbi:hypothetical protein G5714_012293 [Onychostoma macrolepis]|uniref:Uncharacterized protein n=1 Tax=Onychostoma macrolepis TaxID=369639 RepID=A0A7J6CI85_9TELE|nr:hypothetical protein G5714_012293 [Onychostoma macrolepis]